MEYRGGEQTGRTRLWVAPIAVGLLLIVGGCDGSTSGGEDTGGAADVADTAGTVQDADAAGDTAASADGDARDGADGSADTGPSLVGVFQCTNVCETRDDCASSDGDPSSWACEDGRCKSVDPSRVQVETATCEEDFDCSVKTTPLEDEGCQTNDDCTGRMGISGPPICVHLRDTTYCARRPGPDGCYGEDVETEEVESGDVVTVCIDNQLSCIERLGLCYSTCDPEAAEPECPGSRVCSDDGVCICETDEHCDSETSNKCYDGYCGCADDAACESRDEEGRPFECIERY